MDFIFINLKKNTTWVKKRILMGLNLDKLHPLNVAPFMKRFLFNQACKSRTAIKILRNKQPLRSYVVSAVKKHLENHNKQVSGETSRLFYSTKR